MIATVHAPATHPSRWLASRSLASRSLARTASDRLMAMLRGACARADDAVWSVWRWYRVRASVKVLSGLDDHILQDIGVPRPCIVGATLRLVAEEEVIRRREQM